jgi:hypothetical protein
LFPLPGGPVGAAISSAWESLMRDEAFIFSICQFTFVIGGGRGAFTLPSFGTLKVPLPTTRFGWDLYYSEFSDRCVPEIVSSC